MVKYGMKYQMDYDDKVVSNWDSKTNTETLQEFFCRIREFLSRDIEPNRDIFYTMPAQVANQFFESMPEDKENDKQCQ